MITARSGLVALGLMAGAWLLAPAPVDAGSGMDRIKAAGKVTVGTEAALPPFEFVQDGKIVGYGKDILDHVIAGLGVDLDQLDVPFQGILPGLIAKKFDFVATSVMIRPDRSTKFAFTMPIAEAGSTVAKRKGNDAINSVADLNGKVVGALLGSNSEKALREIDAKLKAQGRSGVKEMKFYTSGPENMLALANGQLDAAITLLPTLAVVMKSHPGVFENVGTVAEEKTWMAWVTRPEDADLRDFLNVKIRELRDSGRLYELQEKWFGFRMEVPVSGYLPKGSL